MLLDEIIAHQEIEEYEINNAKLSDDDFALFPAFVQGYVLSSMVWAKLNLYLVTNIQSIGSKSDAL